MDPRILGGILYIPTIYFAYLAYKKFMEMRRHSKLAKDDSKLAGNKEHEEKSGKLLRRFNTVRAFRESHPFIILIIPTFSP